MTRYGRRGSMINGEIVAPYTVQRGHKKRAELVHVCGVIEVPGAIKFMDVDTREFVYVTCCRRVDTFHIGGVLTNDDVTCLGCVGCRGCLACVKNYICDNTMHLGKWTTPRGIRLYPFEMSDEHVLNTFRKLESEQNVFIQDWAPWIAVFTAEARLRGLR